MESTGNEVSVLKHGLKDRLLPRPQESEVVVIVDDIWNQFYERIF